MLTKIIALPIAILIFPAYYRWYHRQERAKQRYASHRRFLRLRDAMRTWTGKVEVTLAPPLEQLARDLSRHTRTSLGTYQGSMTPEPDGW